MSMVEGEPLPGTQNIDGSDKPEFVLSDEPGANEFPSADEQADDDEADEKSSKGKGKGKS